MGLISLNRMTFQNSTKSPKYKNAKMRVGIMDFVDKQDDDSYVQREIEVTLQDKSIVAEQVSTAYRAIMAKQFSPGCGKADCTWCSLLEKYDASYRSNF